MNQAMMKNQIHVSNNLWSHSSIIAKQPLELQLSDESFPMSKFGVCCISNKDEEADTVEEEAENVAEAAIVSIGRRSVPVVRFC